MPFASFAQPVVVYKQSTRLTCHISAAAVPPALTVLREAFAYMDLDASGSLTVGELAARMLKLTNTRVSTTDIENVLKAADTSFNGQVFFKDMVVFAAYEFFCSGATHTGMAGSALQQRQLRVFQ